MLTAEFITAGNATFTVELAPTFAAANDLPPHYTFKVRKPDEDKPYFVSMLTGPDNESDYSYLGVLNKERGTVHLTRASKMTDDSWPVKVLRRVLARLWAGEGAAIEAAGWKVHHEGRCGRCGRVLTVPESIESGIGPDCREKMAA